eukprot:scaffold4155_cov165-Amphora_coffeaeformis.AAC.4
MRTTNPFHSRTSTSITSIGKYKCDDSDKDDKKVLGATTVDSTDVLDCHKLTKRHSKRLVKVPSGTTHERRQPTHERLVFQSMHSKSSNGSTHERRENYLMRKRS